VNTIRMGVNSMRKKKTYTLSDGSIVSAQDVADKVGCRLNTAYLRLTKHSDVETIYSPLQANQRRRGYGTRNDWVDKPATVVMGIPIDPSYMDGSPDGSGSKDRNGVRMSFKEASSLMRYRQQQRDEWLQSKGCKTEDENDREHSLNEFK